jgi:hypothetical protein
MPGDKQVHTLSCVIGADIVSVDSKYCNSSPKNWFRKNTKKFSLLFLLMTAPEAGSLKNLGQSYLSQSSVTTLRMTLSQFVKRL